MRTQTFALFITLLSLGTLACVGSTSTDQIVLERLPEDSLQPQAVVDALGLVHVVYFKGEPAAGDIYYTRRTPDGAYSTPVRVNSQEGSAIALGSVRGAQLAIGRGGRRHVVCA